MNDPQSKIENPKSKIFKVARIGTKDVTVEEAEDSRAACWAAGWLPEWCEAVDITDQVKTLRENGDLHDVR